MTAAQRYLVETLLGFSHIGHRTSQGDPLDREHDLGRMTSIWASLYSYTNPVGYHVGQISPIFLVRCTKWDCMICDAA